MFFVVSYLRKTGTGTTYKSDLFLVTKVFSVVTLLVRDCLLIKKPTQYLFTAKQKLLTLTLSWLGLDLPLSWLIVNRETPIYLTISLLCPLLIMFFQVPCNYLLSFNYLFVSILLFMWLKEAKPSTAVFFSGKKFPWNCLPVFFFLSRKVCKKTKSRLICWCSFTFHENYMIEYQYAITTQSAFRCECTGKKIRRNKMTSDHNIVLPPELSFVCENCGRSTGESNLLFLLCFTMFFQ